MEILFFILGLLFGSFFLVIGIRLPKGEDALFSRSHCDTCNHTLKWYNLIPIFSYLFQRGKCSYCHKKNKSLKLNRGTSNRYLIYGRLHYVWLIL